MQRLAVEGKTGQTLTQLGAAEAAFIKQGDTQRATQTAKAEAAKTHQPPKQVTPADIAREHEHEAKRSSPISEPNPKAW